METTTTMWPDAWDVLFESSPTMVTLSVFAMLAGCSFLELFYYTKNQKKYATFRQWAGDRLDDYLLAVMSASPIFAGLPYLLIRYDELDLFGPILSYGVGLTGIPISLALKKFVLDKILKMLDK